MTSDEKEARLRQIALPLLRAMAAVTNASLVHAAAETKVACVQAARQYQRAAAGAASAFRSFEDVPEARTALLDASVALDVLASAAERAIEAYRAALPEDASKMDAAHAARAAVDRTGKEAGTACHTALSAVAEIKATN